MNVDLATVVQFAVAHGVVDPNAPVRAGSIDLRKLISHQSSVQADASVESVYHWFKENPANFVAVLSGEQLLGICSRRETVALLGGQFGFCLWARKCIAAHLCRTDTRLKAGTDIRETLRTVFARPSEDFYDDVLVVSEQSKFLGFITTETLFRVQNRLLLTNIRDLEKRDREITAYPTRSGSARAFVGCGSF